MRYALENAFDKRSPTQLSKRTYHAWVELGKKTGSFIPAKRAKDLRIKPWHHMALALYRVPQKVTVKYVEEQLAKYYENHGLDSSSAPSYGMIDRFFKSVGQHELNKGRNTGMAGRALKYHKLRTAHGMLPWDELHSDGWASHFTAPRPLTHEYLTLEVWHAHDVATKFIPPMAIGFSECAEVISKCAENMIRFGGVPMIWQVDSTRIVKNNEKFVGHPLLSVSDIAGITIVHPITVGNAQANGKAETFGTWLNNQAKGLCTYQHETMDTLAFRRQQNLLAQFSRAKVRGNRQAIDSLRAQIMKTAPGLFFEEVGEAEAWLEEMRVKWNNHEHSALPKIRDEVTGKKRHQTPNEAMADFKEWGWEPVQMEEDHLTDLFRPRVPVFVRRGRVMPYGKMRFRDSELDRYEGTKVIVSYDIMDGSEVRVLDMKGAFICVAAYDAPVGYRGQTAVEAATEKRLLAAIGRKSKQIEGLKNRAGLTLVESTAGSVIELQRFEYEHVENEPELQRVEYTVEETTEPKLRTLADLLAEEGDNEEPLSREETVDYLWGDVIDEDEDFNPKEEVL
jgi:putative transposase